MEPRASSTLRWSRASLLGLVVLATGGVAHVSAGGLLPGPVAMTALYAACVAGGAIFLGREASALRLVGLLVGGQAFVHTALSALAGHRGEVRPSPTAAEPVAQLTPVLPWDPRSGQSYGAWQEATFGHAGSTEITVPTWMTHAVADIAAHPVMTLLHVLAAIAVAVWLAIGERALWTVLTLARTQVLQLAAAVSQRWAALGTLVLNRAPRLPLPDFSFDPLPRLPLWWSSPVRRGPPQLLLAR